MAENEAFFDCMGIDRQERQGIVRSNFVACWPPWLQWYNGILWNSIFSMKFNFYKTGKHSAIAKRNTRNFSVMNWIELVLRPMYLWVNKCAACGKKWVYKESTNQWPPALPLYFAGIVRVHFPRYSQMLWWWLNELDVLAAFAPFNLPRMTTDKSDVVYPSPKKTKFEQLRADHELFLRAFESKIVKL